MFRHSVGSTFSAIISAAFYSSLLIAATPSPAHAAEINLLGPASFRILFPKLLTEFEKSSGNNVTAGYAPLGVITERVIKGEPVDVAIVSGKQNEELQKQGKLLAGSRVEIAQVGFTVFIKKGAAKPDLSSADALKRALLAAESIAVGDPARGGGASLYTIGLMKRLGISEEVKAKSRLEPSGTEIAEAVAKGEAELGIGVASDLSLVAGIESVALPAEVQNYSLYVAGIIADTKQVDAAKELTAFLTSPAVNQALTDNGFEPR
ncbi:molybdate ABC transporter substrate-binding protein [Bradyrhizobium hipponense]|uniref:molybdate ABC transporter substrate-binding protein n=1 Tax=Bradyrhizobium hipponense TaxID=2605638 RepID=UPI001652FF37|nr:molybdate ABC transporter substrate-binding protein [Bradyrhizobium hipponense]